MLLQFSCRFSCYHVIVSQTAYRKQESCAIAMGVPYAPGYPNGHISATGDPIHFMFCSRVGFSGTADLMALFSIRTN